MVDRMMASPDSNAIPHTRLLQRYLDVKRADQAERLRFANADIASPGWLVSDFLDSVDAFSAYFNDEDFHPDRGEPVGEPFLWKTNDVAARLHPNRSLTIRDPQGASDTSMALTYVGREIQPARTTGNNSHAVQQRAAKEGGETLSLVTLDLLLKSETDLPVAAEVKTPTDVDAYYALIQVLVAASQLATSSQAKRLREAYPDAGFSEPTDVAVEALILAVDPARCGAPDKVAAIAPVGTPKYRAELDAAAERLAGLIAADRRLGSHLRRVALLELGLEPDGEMVADIAWSFPVESSAA